MLKFFLKKMGEFSVSLFLISVLTFLLLRAAPGGPFDSEKAWPEEIQLNLNKKYGLDLPLYEQLGKWLMNTAQGDLGESFQYLGMPVAQILTDSIPVTLILGSLALFFSIFIGIPLGVTAATHRGQAIDFISHFISISGVSLPSYLVASILVLVFSMWLGVLPPALLESPSSLVLPVLTLALRPLAMVARLTRTALIETLHTDYIRTARAKGLPESLVIYKHALKNSLIPIVTLLGPLAAHLLTGSFVVEIVFQLPGTGKHFVSSVLNRDYPLVMGLTLLYGVVLLITHFFVEMSYGWIDPRIQTEERSHAQK